MDQSDPLYVLITQTPDINSNTTGSTARSALVNKVKGATPGRHTELFSSGKLFKDLFFPNYSPVSYEADVVSNTSLDDNWWSSVSVAVLCQSMYYQTSDLRSQLVIDNINSAMDAFNVTLREKAVKWYTHILLKDYMKYAGDIQSAKNGYIDQICTSKWVTYKMKQYNDGTWLNPSWEEFHHWIKLSALGASDDEINTVIEKLKNLGLRIFPDVDAGAWQHYFVWYSPSSIDHNDIDKDAARGELEEVYLPSVYGTGSYMNEENSFEFTASDQPGEQYRSVPSSSCFSSRTKVLMANGMLTEIEQIKVGDHVASPHGPRSVMFVSTPNRNGRTLFSINNYAGFWFTATHPFINAQHSSSKQPYYLAHSPLQLDHAVPTLGSKGIGCLGVHTRLVHSNGEMEVLSIQAQQADGEEELLYDLILEPDCTGLFEYFVGDEKMQFLVASEIPSFSTATVTEKVACAIILNMIKASLKPIESMKSSMLSQQFNHKIQMIAFQISAGLLCNAAQYSTPAVSHTERFKYACMNFAEYLKDAADMFVSQDGKYNAAAGEAFAHLSASRLFYQISFILDLGFRKPALMPAKKDWMGLSVLSIHTHSTSISDMCLTPEIIIHLHQFPPIKHALTEGLDQFILHVKKVFYISCRNENNDNEFDLSITIGNAGLAEKVFNAFTHIVLPLHHGYRHYCMPVFSDNKEIGFLVMDVRMLSEAEVEEEKSASSGWEHSSNLPLALRLSEYANKKLFVLCSTNEANTSK